MDAILEEGVKAPDKKEARLSENPFSRHSTLKSIKSDDDLEKIQPKYKKMFSSEERRHMFKGMSKNASNLVSFGMESGTILRTTTKDTIMSEESMDES